MSVQPPPVAPAGRPTVSIRETLLQTRQTIVERAGQTLSPMFAVQMPVAVISAIAIVFVYLAVFPDEPVRPLSEMVSDGSRGLLFALVTTEAFQLLFALVARGATVVAFAAAANGKHMSLSEALDPAFTRLGGLLLLAFTLAAVVIAGVFSIIGIFFLPYLLIRWGLAVECYMLEGQSAFGSLRRSWQLTSGVTLRLLGLLLAAIALMILPLLAILALGLVVGGGRTAEVLLAGGIGIVQSALEIPLMVYLSGVTTLFYLKVKVRNDAGTLARN